MRRKMIAGNWKMNKTPAESAALALEMKELSGETDHADVVICPTYLALEKVTEIFKKSKIETGSQDIHWENPGAYTGKVSADMVRSVGAKYSIIGHSEQRLYFHETNETVNKKIKKALQDDLIPIICVGETLEQRDQDLTHSIVESQIRSAFWGLSPARAEKCIIAYEPVWAIGTGRNATPEQAQEIHRFIRDLVKILFGDGISSDLRILYGGSMKPDNAAGLLKQPDIDGGLIGGASMKADSFQKIIDAAR